MSTEPDMISLEHFPSTRGVMLNTKLYNAATLARHLKTGKKNVPHSRRQLTEAEYERIMHKAGRYHAWNHVPGTDKLQYSQYHPRTAHKKILMRNSGSQILQAKHAAALISKIRKRLDALLGKLQNKVLTDPEIQSEIHEDIIRLEDVNRHLKKMDNGWASDGWAIDFMQSLYR
jgi:hypothetical protein